jgi:tetratricopeptide (TPR) repeat protein
LMETAMGRALYFARRYEAAAAQCRRALELDPDYRLAHFNLGRALVETGRGGEAIAELKKATRRGEALYLGGLGYAYARSEQQERARGVLKQLEALAERNYVSAYERAKVHIGLGQEDRAMECLERAYAEGAVGLVLVKVDPVFDPLHSDARFQALWQRMGLPA